jgi:hypothetical protein
MATFSTVPIDEARTQVLPPRRATQERYRQYVRQVTPENAGRLELAEVDRPITERARLKAAAKAEGIYLLIQRRGNTIVFWPTTEPPQTRQDGKGKGTQAKRGSQRRK